MNTSRTFLKILLLLIAFVIKILSVSGVYSPMNGVENFSNNFSSKFYLNNVSLKMGSPESALTLKKSKQNFFKNAKIEVKRHNLTLISSTFALESEDLKKEEYLIPGISSSAVTAMESNNSITSYKRKTKSSEKDDKSVGTILQTYGEGKNGVSDASYLPVFLTEPESAYVVRNRPAILKCRAVYALQLQFKCSGSSQPPPSSYEKHVDPHTGVHLEEVTASITRDLVDEYFGKGSFKCECHAWSSKGVVKSQAAHVNVSYIRKHFLTSPTSIRANLGSKATLHCVPPNGNPAPRIAWLKNNEILDVKIKGIIISKGSLTFSQVSLQDMANYTCTAENIAGKRTSETAVLIVYANGGWNTWSSWTDCKCSNGKIHGKMRTRSCNNPVPLNGGQICLGAQIQKSVDCISCPDTDWALYLGLSFITVVFFIFGTVLLSCSRRGLDSNTSIRTTNSNLMYGIEKKSNQISLESNKINYEYISEHNCSTNKRIIANDIPEPHYDIPNLSSSYVDPIDELTLHYFNHESDSPNPTGKSFYGVHKKASDMTQMKKSMSKFATASTIFQSSGGRLRLYDGEIILYIPNLAISKNQRIHVSLMVLSEDIKNISVACENVMVCSAIVHCSPSEYNLLKPAIIKVPHCLTIREQWNVKIYYSEKNCDENASWRLITIVGQETINTPIFSQLDPSHVFVMTEQLGSYAVVAEPKPYILKNDLSIQMRLFAFIQMTPNTSIIRIYVVRDFPYSKDTCSYVETQLGGTFLGESSCFQFYFNNKNLVIQVRPIASEMWTLTTSEEQEQVIPYAHIISYNSILHCEFTFKQTDQNCISANLDVRFIQCSSGKVGEIHSSWAISKRCTPHHKETSHTISTLDSRGQIVSNISSLETLQLPLLTKHKICAALDPPRTDENDWRLLAAKLRTDRYIAYFATKSSPTEQILNLLECRANNSCNVITELLSILKEMNRFDVVRIIEQDIEKQWI